jgi:hypothetical protein
VTARHSTIAKKLFIPVAPEPSREKPAFLAAKVLSREKLALLAAVDPTGEKPAFLAAKVLSREKPALLAAVDPSGKKPAFLAAKVLSREKPALLAAVDPTGEKPAFLAAKVLSREKSALLAAVDPIGEKPALPALAAKVRSPVRKWQAHMEAQKIADGYGNPIAPALGNRVRWICKCQHCSNRSEKCDASNRSEKCDALQHVGLLWLSALPHTGLHVIASVPSEVGKRSLRLSDGKLWSCTHSVQSPSSPFGRLGLRRPLGPLFKSVRRKLPIPDGNMRLIFTGVGAAMTEQ